MDAVNHSDISVWTFTQRPRQLEREREREREREGERERERVIFYNIIWRSVPLTE